MTNTTNTTSRTPAVSATAEDKTLTLRFADGDTLAIHLDQLSVDIFTQATLHGLKQKLVDAAAIARNTETGASASLSDKKAAVVAVYERLMNGEWNATRATGDGTGKGSLLLLALARMQPARDIGELTSWLAGLSDEQRAALGKNAKVLPIIQTIQAERAALAAKKSGIDSDELLSALLGD
jgi:hypothetical protein